MRIIQMHVGKQGMGSAIKELEADVAADGFEQRVVAHSECIFESIAARVPTIDRSQRTRIGRHECWN